jgi:spore germination cell wall hydrolase CwlJ-like protein
MFWRRLTDTLGAIWTRTVEEIERNSQALKQGAAAMVVFAAAAAAMPAMAERGAEQRADADWNAKAMAFQKDIEAEKFGGAEKRVEPAAHIQLAALPAPGGWRARAEAMLAENSFDRHAMVIQASVRDASSLAPLRPFQPASLQLAEKTTRESKCLAEAVYYEARGESYQGQMAVAEVVVNRSRSREYPSTVCGVVYQGSDRSTGCQFTFTCDGSLDRHPRGDSWARAEMISAQVMMGMAAPITHRATHYHTVEVAPVWSARLVETTRIGSHIFYRFPTRAEKHAAQIADSSTHDDDAPIA